MKISSKLPHQSGVYLFKDRRKKVLYIGKALDLDKRVKSYFRKNIKDLRVKKMLEKAKSLDFVITKSEIESFLLEVRLVKEYRPQYNVKLKDDKRYLAVGFTKEVYPALHLLRQPEKNKELLDWFGPFPTSRVLREVLRLIRRIFPYRTCFRLPAKPCLYFHLQLCPGMCALPVKNYDQTIKSLRLFMAGEIEVLSDFLKKKMALAAKKMNFEEAERIKNQLQGLEKILLNFQRMAEAEKPQKQLQALRKILVVHQGIDPLVIHRLEVFDIANLGEKIVVGGLAVFTEGEPDPAAYRQFKVKKRFGGDPGALKEIVFRRFQHPEWIYPQVILVDGGKPQLSAVFSVLQNKDLAGNIGLLGLAKRKEEIIIPRIEKEKIISWKILRCSPRSEVLQLLQAGRDEAHRFGQRYYRWVYRKLTLTAFGRE